MKKDSFLKTQENFKKAFLALERALADPIVEDRDRAGIIQSFEFTYELSWKLLKKYLALVGHETGSARETFQMAYQLKVISDEKDSLRMMDDRNLSSYTYNQELAKEIVERIQNQYFRVFKTLRDLQA